MIDIATQLKAIDREVTRRPGPDGEEVSVRIRRTYDAAIADVWDALTDPDRMKRWFLPVTGDLRVGGSFQLEGNAGGEILGCEPPRRLRVSFGGPTSLVELRLSPEGEERTVSELGDAWKAEHSHRARAARALRRALGPPRAADAGPGTSTS